MKTLHPLKLLGLFTGIISTGFIYALPGNEGGCVKGRVTSEETKQPVISATIAFENETTTKGFFTHEKGRFYACYIPEGVYTVTVSFGATTITVPNVTVTDGGVKELNFALPVDLSVVSFDAPVIAPHSPGFNSSPLLSEPQTEYVESHVKDVQPENINMSIVMENMWAPDFKEGAGDMTVSWYVDGYKVMGTPHVPIRGAESILNYKGSIPAKYGDSNGMIVAVETRSSLE